VFCSKCGQALAYGSSFCGRCGSSTGQPYAPERISHDNPWTSQASATYSSPQAYPVAPDKAEIKAQRALIIAGVLLVFSLVAIIGLFAELDFLGPFAVLVAAYSLVCSFVSLILTFKSTKGRKKNALEMLMFVGSIVITMYAFSATMTFAF